MGLFNRVRTDSHTGEDSRRRYTCLACQASFDLQYHSCPECGAYDVRRTKWVE